MFNDLDSSSWAVLCLLVLGLTLFIIHQIIKSASRSDAIVNRLDKQNSLLIKLLENSGISKGAIEEALSTQPNS